MGAGNAQQNLSPLSDVCPSYNPIKKSAFTLCLSGESHPSAFAAELWDFALGNINNALQNRLLRLDLGFFGGRGNVISNLATASL